MTFHFDVWSAVIGVAAAGVAFFFTGFLREAGKDAYSWIKRKWKPEAKQVSRESFNAAAVSFRAQFVGALQQLRQSERNNDVDVFKILTEDVIPNHEAAKVAFEPYLSTAGLAGFNAAWRAYTDPNWVKSPKPGNIDQRRRDVAIALDRLEKVLAFANPK
jgi:hypothetical protein